MTMEEASKQFTDTLEALPSDERELLLTYIMDCVKADAEWIGGLLEDPALSFEEAMNIIRQED